MENWESKKLQYGFLHKIIVNKFHFLIRYIGAPILSHEIFSYFWHFIFFFKENINQTNLAEKWKRFLEIQSLVEKTFVCVYSE